MPVSGTKPDQARTYQLHIHVGEEILPEIGRLGTFRFPAGKYIYTGSARRNMVSRLKRHLASKKTLRWHIDYLLAAESVYVSRIYLTIEMECESNQSLKGSIPVTGFGASDCRAGCKSHLIYIGQL